jgi:hypothetical protein
MKMSSGLEQNLGSTLKILLKNRYPRLETIRYREKRSDSPVINISEKEPKSVITCSWKITQITHPRYVIMRVKESSRMRTFCLSLTGMIKEFHIATKVHKANKVQTAEKVESEGCIGEIVLLELIPELYLTRSTFGPILGSIPMFMRDTKGAE